MAGFLKYAEERGLQREVLQVGWEAAYRGDSGIGYIPTGGVRTRRRARKGVEEGGEAASEEEGGG